MRRCRHYRPPLPALLLALALTLLAAAPAAACSYVVDENATAGPFPAPEGGAWFVLPPFDDGSLEAVHLAVDGGFVRSVSLRAPDLDLFEPVFGEFAVAEDGGFRVTGWPRDEGAGGRQLVAFDADGTPLGRLAVDHRLKIFGFDPQGVAHAFDRRPDSRLAVHRLDPLSGRAAEAFVTPEPVMPGVYNSCGPPFQLATDADGAVFVLSTQGGRPTDDGEGTRVLQRFSPHGVETASWRLPDAAWYRIDSGRGDAVLLVRETTVWKVGADGALGRTELGEPRGQAVPVADGGFLVRDASGLRWVDEEGEPLGGFGLGPTPKGSTWEELQERRAAAAGSPIGRALQGGDAAAAAIEELSAAAPEAVDLLIDWLAASPADEASLAAYREIFHQLFVSDPHGVGLRLTDRLDHLPEALVPTLTSMLIVDWERPAASFVARLADELNTEDRRRRFDAASAFEHQAERYPAPPAVQRRYLAELAKAADERTEGLDPEWFFLAQLADAGPLLDAVLAEPAHPARFAALGWLEGVANRVDWHIGDDGGAALARWAGDWSNAADPRQAGAARLLFAATGDPAAVATLPDGVATGAYDPAGVAAVVRALGRRRPETLEGGLRDALTAVAVTAPLAAEPVADLLHALGEGAPAGWWSALAERLAEPRLPGPAGEAVAGLLLHAGDERWAAIDGAAVARVVLSGYFARRFGRRGGGHGDGFRLAARAWRRLETEPDARARLEVWFRDACEVDLAAFDGGLRPPACLLAMRDSGVGARVPDAWLTALLEHYRPLGILRVKAGGWQPALSAVAARRGPWPGLAELLREDHAMVPGLTLQAVDAAVLEATIGIAPSEPRRYADLPLLALGPLPGDG